MLNLDNLHVLDLKKIWKSTGLPKEGVLKILVMPDWHWPHIDMRVLTSVGAFARNAQPNILVQLGDLVDNWEVSPHNQKKSYDLDTTFTSIKRAITYLSHMKRDCGADFSFCTLGNHDIWIEEIFKGKRQFIITKKVAEVLNKGNFVDDHCALYTSLASDSFVTENQIQFFPYNDIVQLGKLNFTHGLYSGDMAAKKTVQAIGGNVICGHTESVSEQSIRTFRGPEEGVTAGTMRDIAHVRKELIRNGPMNWCHSVTLVEMFFDGTYTRHTMKIINGRFAFNGVVYG